MPNVFVVLAWSDLVLLLQEGADRMQSFCHSSKCRHAQVVNFFAPGALKEGQPCK